MKAWLIHWERGMEVKDTYGDYVNSNKKPIKKTKKTGRIVKKLTYIQEKKQKQKRMNK